MADNKNKTKTMIQILNQKKGRQLHKIKLFIWKQVTDTTFKTAQTKTMGKCL